MIPWAAGARATKARWPADGTPGAGGVRIRMAFAMGGDLPRASRDFSGASFTGAYARSSHSQSGASFADAIFASNGEPSTQRGPFPGPRRKRRIGVEPRIEVPDSFFDPLPDDFLEAFWGRIE